MTDPRHMLFDLINSHFNELDSPSFYDAFMSDDEECPFCREVFNDMEKGVTLYREEFIQVQVPSEVHIRLHKVIKSRWFGMLGDETDNGR